MSDPVESTKDEPVNDQQQAQVPADQDTTPNWLKRAKFGPSLEEENRRARGPYTPLGGW